MEQAVPAFDALVAAYEPGPAAGGLRALEMVAGRHLVEHQLRRAVGAGAERLLLLVDDMPVELASLVTTLRREGIAIEPVAGIDVAAQSLAADRAVLLIADACLPEEGVIRRTVACGAPAVATLPDDEANARYERIDAGARWAGVALLDGARVATAAAMLGNWDPVSTLLRRAVQEGATRLDVAGTPPTLLLDGTEVAEAEDRIITAARATPCSWAERWISGPIVRLAVPRLLARGTVPELLGWPAALLALSGGLAATVGARWPALIALLLAVPLLDAGRQLARINDRRMALDRVAGAAIPIGGTLAAIGLGFGLMASSGQWGWLLVALLLVAASTLAHVLRPLAQVAAPLWLARLEPILWVVLPFALIGRWNAGLVAATLYAGASAAMLGTRIVRGAMLDTGLPGPKLF